MMFQRPTSSLPTRRGFLTAAAAAPILATGAGLFGGAQAQAASGDAAYVMGYFTESVSGLGNNYGLHLAVSTDSLNWTPLNQNNPVATPTAGTLGLRDPHIIRKQTGGFVVLATDLNGQDWSAVNQYIHCWDSADLRTFTNYRRLKLNSLSSHTWAPEAFWDASRGQYGIIYSIYNGTRDVIFVNYTTDFVTVSSPILYFDPGFNVLDATMHYDAAGAYYLYYKRTSDSTLWGSKSTSLAAGAFNSGTYTGPYGSSIEAPIVAKSLTKNTWYLWGDNYGPEFYAWSTTSLDTGSWTALSKLDYNQPLNSKHATICTITTAEFNNLLSTWGAPTWNRLKPVGYPDYYVRHYNYAGQISAYPFDPYADSLWTMVPGLADSAGVSFRSVNYPSRYLRHSDSTIKLDASDGTTLFTQDATFYRTAGLADSTRASFRSYNYPDRYLRHSNFLLRIDPLSSSSALTDRQDATFAVVY